MKKMKKVLVVLTFIAVGVLLGKMWVDGNTLSKKPIAVMHKGEVIEIYGGDR